MPELGVLNLQHPAPVTCLPQVLDWIKAIVDGHLARLLMTRSSLPHIQKLQSTLSMQVRISQVCVHKRQADHACEA